MPTIPINNKKCPALRGILQLVSIAMLENTITGTIRKINDRSMTKGQYRKLSRWLRCPRKLFNNKVA